MREALGAIARWRHEGLRSAIARVVAVEGSGPRELGAVMAVNERGEVVGSVSGGCVEGAVVAEALGILEGDGVARLVTFGIADDDALAVGLTCGGTIHLFVEAADEAVGPGGATTTGALVVDLEGAIEREEDVALVTLVKGPAPGVSLLLAAAGTVTGSLGDADLDRVGARDAGGELAANRSDLRHYGAQGEARGDAVALFVQSFASPARMVICGAVDFSAALARVAKVLGYKVTVCDARATFATPQRFPMADTVVADWPDRYLATIEPPLGPRDAVCVLTHDPKFDVPVIAAALETEVGYLGAMGSRRTHADRSRRLVEAGVAEDALSRVMGPIGIDIGARTPEETAVSICSEIIALRTGRAGAHLRDTAGPIHGDGTLDRT